MAPRQEEEEEKEADGREQPLDLHRHFAEPIPSFLGVKGNRVRGTF